MARIGLPSRLYVVDTNPESLQKAQAGYEQMPVNEKIFSVDYLSNLSQLPAQLDLAIIATGSQPRMQLTRELIENKEVRYILFEKFLFPSLAAYNAVATLLEKHGVKAWVNCPRRLLEVYNDLRQILKGRSDIVFRLTGGNWGLGCNSIHFIDIFSMLTGEQDISIDVNGLQPVIHASKRPGYIEFSGTVTGQSANTNRISLTSDVNSNDPIVIDIKAAGGLSVNIQEGKKELTIENNGSRETRSFAFPFQSELSGRIGEAILTNGDINLTTYAESAALHLQFLDPVVKWYNKLTGEQGDYCPIT